MKTSHRIAALLAVALVALAAGLFLARDALREKTASVALVGGPFKLASSRGGEVDSESLRGKPYAIFFGFTHCPEVCPTTLYEMSTLLAKLGDEAKDLRVFFVTVDPERDTLEAMRDYVSNFDPRIEALVPTEAQLTRIASDFRVYYAKVPTSDGGYTMDHTALVYLMDAKGDFSGTISYGEALETQEAKLRKLLAGS